LASFHQEAIVDMMLRDSDLLTLLAEKVLSIVIIVTGKINVATHR
jgi:hypothetical protein